MKTIDKIKDISKQLWDNVLQYVVVGAALYYNPITIINKTLAVFYVTWILYLALMNLDRAYKKGTISNGALFLARPLLGLGALMDFASMCIASVVLLDIPKLITFTKTNDNLEVHYHQKELLLTTKLTRLKITDAGKWRGWMAKMICSKLLDDYDPSGEHCDGKQ